MTARLRPISAKSGSRRARAPREAKGSTAFLVLLRESALHRVSLFGMETVVSHVTSGNTKDYARTRGRCRRCVSLERRTGRQGRAPSDESARTDSVARQERSSEEMMGRERCRGQRTSGTVHAEFQSLVPSLAAVCPKERLRRQILKDGPEETFSRKILTAAFLENSKCFGNVFLVGAGFRSRQTRRS